MNYSTSATTTVVNYKDIHRVRGVHRYVFLNALINIYYSIDVIDNDKEHPPPRTTSSPAVDSML